MARTITLPIPTEFANPIILPFTEHKTYLKCLHWEILHLFLIGWQQHVSKELEHHLVYHCEECPLLLTSFWKHLETEESSCRSFGRGVLSLSRLIRDSSSSRCSKCFQLVKGLDCQLASSGPRLFYEALLL